MTGSDDPRAADARAALDTALRDDATAPELRGLPDDVVDRVVASFADEHGGAALPLLGRLAASGADRGVRRAARRALYRLAQRGIAPAAPAAPRPIVPRRSERAVQAWLSGVDGSGSRATWIVFEGAYGGLRLCSLILNDTLGITEVAGGDITRKRLDRELAALRESQKLPWVETDPARAVGLVAEALAVHAAASTSPPAAFAPWRAPFASAPVAEPPTLPDTPDPALLERSATLLERPELAGWFLDPESVQSDAVELLQTRESRLVLSDQLKAEREAAIVDGVIERELDPPASRRWSRRLAEMALVLDGAGAPEPAASARAVAAALASESFEPRRLPFVRALAARSLEIAGEVTLGRVSAAEVSRKPKAP
ncbi:MAG TPA: hypothetical protein VK548_19615 [Candidatus Acidoferrum sp.]|nr:hypothetical protein [Candidatus Acidoferrum sp.]